jgi:hypothetical protein
MVTLTPPPPSPGWTAHDNDARLGWKIQALAPPLVLVVAWFATSSGGLSAMMSRIFLGMWIHELGHALTAWFTGFFAFPGPWKTIVGDERSWSVRFVLGALLVSLIVLGVHFSRRWWIGVGGTLLAVFVVGAFVVSTETAQMGISFGGDAGNLVLGPALMLVGQLPADHPIKRRWLHWGFLVIGAFAFCDVAHQWARANDDLAEIPFGRIDGVGLSDASVLVERYGWSELTLVDRYVTLSWIGLVSFAVGHVLLSWRSNTLLPTRATAERTVRIAAPLEVAAPALEPVRSNPRRSREPIDL